MMPRGTRALLAVVFLVPGVTDSQNGAVQSPSSTTAGDSSLPFGVGERLVYDVKFGPLKVGEGSMEVIDIQNIRGRNVWHTRFRVRGGVLFYRVDDVLESWFDTETFSSMRFVQDFDEGGRVRERRYEIFPERGTYQENDKPEVPSVRNPLDEGSFLYFVRMLDLEVDSTYTFERYFRPERNPVTLKVVRREKITVPAGTYNSVVVRPVIRSPRGIFTEGSQAEVWLSDDQDRIVLQMKSRTSIGSLSLFLKSHRPPRSPGP